MNPPSLSPYVWVCVCVLVLVSRATLFGQLPPGHPLFRSDQILVKPKGGLNEVAGLHAALAGQVRKTFPRFGNLQVVRIPEGANVEAVVAAYNRSGLVEYAEPDYYITAAAMPNDPGFVLNQWNLKDSPNGIYAEAAWDYRNSAESIVVQ